MAAVPARRLEPARRPTHPGLRVTPARDRAGAVAKPIRPAAKPTAVTAPRPQLRVVPPRVRRRRAGLLAVAVCGITFLVMLGLTVFQARIAADQMRLETVDRDIRAEQSTYTRLRLAVAQAQTPDAAASRAKADGLVPPPRGIEAYVTPSLEQVIEVARTGAGAEPGSALGLQAATAVPVDGAAPNQGATP